MAARIVSATSGGTSCIPWSSRACTVISARSSCSSSARPTQVQPLTTSLQLNCFTDPPGSTGRPMLQGAQRLTTIVGVCRVLAYLGLPLPVRHLLYDADNGLVAQSYSPQMMNTFLNLG